MAISNLFLPCQMALHVNQNRVSRFPLSSITPLPPWSRVRTNDAPLTDEDIVKWRCQCKMPQRTTRTRSSWLKFCWIIPLVDAAPFWWNVSFCFLPSALQKAVLAIYMGCKAAVLMGRRRRRFTITHVGEHQCTSVPRTSLNFLPLHLSVMKIAAFKPV